MTGETTGAPGSAAQAPTDGAPPAEAEQAEPPQLAGDDVRLGPELTDEPQAGATEPTD